MAKPTRTITEINQDYFQTAAILGDLEWKMSKFPNQIEDLKRKLRSIDSEMDEIQKIQAKNQAKNGAKTTETPLVTPTPQAPTETTAELNL